MERAVLVALQVFVVFISFAPVFIVGQADTEHLTWSIDCGNDLNYTDNAGIPWVTDELFIQTGKNAPNVTIYPSNQAYVNKEQLSTLRYFDDSRKRHCYVLPVKAGTTYLVRPTFFLGNLTDSIKRDISFKIYLNGTEWLSLPFHPDSDYNKTQSYEAIIYSPGAVLNICLLPDHNAAAFISTLELRAFTNGMYSSAADKCRSGYRYQDLHVRINAGAMPAADDHPLSYVRYPDDPYDRLWWAPRSSDGGPGVKDIGNQSLNVQTPNESSLNVQVQNRPPDVVMNDAWTRSDTDTLYYYTTSDHPMRPMIIYFYVMNVGENSREGGVTSFEYSVNDILIDTFTVSSVPQEIIRSTTIPKNDYNITFTPTVGSTSPAVLNAFETYFLRDMDTSVTAIADVNAITNVKQAFNLMDWSGDPCLPSPYDWLNCTFVQKPSGNNDAIFSQYSPIEYRITGVSLTNATTRSKERNAIADITSLTSVNKLYLNNNGFDDGSINFSRLKNLTVLDVSNNNFGGDVLEFMRSAGISNVQELYISDNQFTNFSYFPSSNGPLFSNLTKLDLSKNHIGGNVTNFIRAVSALGYSVPGEGYSLKEVYAANNFLEGRFNFNQFGEVQQGLQQAPEILDLDDQNIGTLDLVLDSGDLFNLRSRPLLIKLRNNNIDNVNPELDLLSWRIHSRYQLLLQYSDRTDRYYMPQILLSGNPWCRTTDNKTLAQRYLCRNESNDVFDYDDVGVARPKLMKPKEKKMAEIVGISVGIGFFFICCISICFAIMLRKLRKKSKALAEVQEALTKQKVHPPLYSYAELRRATNNFAHSNNLGQGAYGAVYRGKLTDGTQVAIKKLFQDRQVLGEFLNEALLISGIKHRNLAQLKGCSIEQDQRILVYEYAENGNLAEALWGQSSSVEKKEPMNWKRRLNICVGIARGLSYLHEELQPRIIHRDIKPANILIDRNFNAKIADFGLARSFLEEQTQADYTHVAGTFGYLAPEYITQGQLTEKADIFGYGVVLLEIVSGRKCIDQSFSPEKVSLLHWADTCKKAGNLKDIVDSSINSSCNEEETLQVIDIAFSCLHITPSHRPSMSQVVTMLQGNASCFNHPRPGFSFPSESIPETSNQIGLPSTLSLTVVSNLIDNSDQLPFLSDNTNRSNSQEMSSLSGR